MKKLYLSLITILALSFCSTGSNKNFEVNYNHLDYLYEEITVDGIDMAFIHIYSNYPEYEYIDDDDEGTACVDDAARAAIFYLNNYKYLNNAENLIKNKKLLKFLIYLQAENGYFYNFMWKDYSINKTFKTSISEPNWWSWRALWALSESYPYYEGKDDKFAIIIKESIIKLINRIKKDIPKSFHTEIFEGIELPTWLPYKYAADQASILLIGLSNYVKIDKDSIIENYIRQLQQGIMKMQIKDKTNQFYGAFLSWQNLWHAWGNSQSYALLKSYEVLPDSIVIKSALTELDNFYTEISKIGYLNSFKVVSENNKVNVIEKLKYSQIAYNIRPMIFALIEANKLTHDPKYSELAGIIAKWFTGDNLASSAMYNHENGIIFDGIESETKINMNSGAESTIEGLLSLLEISQNEEALLAYLKK